METSLLQVLNAQILGVKFNKLWQIQLSNTTPINTQNISIIFPAFPHCFDFCYYVLVLPVLEFHIEVIQYVHFENGFIA